MAIATDWIEPPAGQVLMPGRCGALDDDGEACASFDHYPRPHLHTGLRRWPESTDDRVLIRCYDAAHADEFEAMEVPLFAQFGFAPIAHQDFVRTEAGGVHVGWALVIGPLLAPVKEVTIRLRLVCFARQS